MPYVIGLAVVAVAAGVLAALVLRTAGPARRLAAALGEVRDRTADRAGLLVARRAALGVELARRRTRRRGTGSAA